MGFIAFFTEIWLYIKGKKFRIGINFADIWAAVLEGTRPLIIIKEGAPPLRGVPYPTF